MRVLDRREDSDILSLRIDTADDLYYLSQIIGEGDRVGCQSLRRPEAKDDMVRSDSQPRRRVYLVIEVEGVEFQAFTDALRIKGRIVEGPPDVKGHHTQVVEPGTVIDLAFKEPNGSVLEILEEALKASDRPNMIVISVDDSDCSIFRLRDYGLEEVETLNAGAGGKMFPSGDRWSSLIGAICETVRPMYMEGMPIVILGPSFVKERVRDHLLKEMRVSPPRIILLSASSGGLSGVREALSKGESLQDVVRENRVVRESSMVDELFARIARGYGATYGPDQVRKAISSGAVEVLLISEDLFRDEEMRRLMDAAREIGASTMIVSAHHDAGKKFSRMGGLAAFLRFDPGGPA
ncbi:MAG: mRNA surveillance protein pelota [Candidatus Thermoplasmatota archaeon]|nr:mRNA surveillance protein pelota [Candidatus Thermoplasmatota archaeon]